MSEQGIAIHESADLELRNSDPDRTGERAGSLHHNLRRVALLAVLYAFSSCLAVDALVTRESRNTDLWWHLGSGAWIVQHHQLPSTDPFSLAGANKIWVAYNWLFELTLYGSYRWLGLLGTAIYMMTIAFAIGLALYHAIQKRMSGFAGAIALTALGVFLMVSLFSVRPWLFSILLFIIEMDILFAELVDAPENTSFRRLWLLPFLFVLWANLHIQFIYGLAVLGLAAVTQGLEVVPDGKGVRLSFTAGNHRLRVWLVTGLSLLATLVNPYFWQVYRPVWEIARDRVPMNFITELLAPDFRSTRDYLVILIVMAAAFVLGRVRLRSDVFAGALLVVTSLVSIRMVRDEWFVLIVALLIIAEGWGRRAAPNRVPLSRRFRFAAAALGVLLVLTWAKKQDLSNARLENDFSGIFPVKASEFVAQQEFPGPLYNYFDWGGYLIWRLPRLPVSMDGRTNIYGGAHIAQSVATWDCAPGWKSDPELLSSNLVIGPVGMPLSGALKDDSRYRLVYQDSVAAVFVKQAK